MDAYGVGALNVDLIYRLDSSSLKDEIRPGSEMRGTEEEFSSLLDLLEDEAVLMHRSGGGSAANTMYALHRMGFVTGVIGAIGTGEHGDFLLDSLEGVDCSRVKRVNGSGMCISILSDGERSLLVLPNANDLLEIEKEDISSANGAALVHLSSFAGDDSFRQQVRLVRALDSRVMVSLDPGELYASKGLEEMAPLISSSDIMFPSGREVELLTGKEPEEGCRELLTNGPDVVVCTLGDEGAIVMSGHDDYYIEAVATEAVDKTGAGDVYAAAFLAGRLRRWGLKSCGRFAALASARSISKYGREGYPDEEMMERFEEETSRRR